MIDIQSKDFLTGEELSAKELQDVLQLAMDLKSDRSHMRSYKPLQDRTLALLFEKPSLRTRFSFSIGMMELGGFIVESVSTSRKQEEPRDLARVLSGYCHGLMIRCHRDQDIEEIAKHSTVPVINGLSDLHHPCQALADLMTIHEEFGSLDGRRIAYVGDGNNVLHSLLLLAPQLGISVHYCCPPNYEPDSFVLQTALRLKAGSAEILAFDEPRESVGGCDVVYTDVWTSMGVEEERHERDAIFRPYQVNEELMDVANESAIFLHCLPMDRGKEVSSTLPEQSCSRIFRQAENRLHTQKALLVGLLGDKK